MLQDRETELDLSAFWGKLGRGAVSQGFHPLICHMVDVAAVAREMWDAALSPAARRAITADLGIGDEAAARAWVSFLAGAHDIGKACPVFQYGPDAKALYALYARLGPRQPGLRPRDAPHGTVTAVVLPGILAGHGVNPGLGGLLSIVTGGHHGVFPRLSHRQHVENRGAVGGAGWRTQRLRLIEALAEVILVPWGTPPTALDGPTAMVLAGLVSVADWIGSDVRYFQYESKTRTAAPKVSLEEYAARAQRQASRALDRLGWLGWEPPEQRRSFHDLFAGTVPEPNKLQLTVEELLQRLADRPGLLVIEAPMGEGKTEAAFYAADAWGVSPGPRGMYLALPTQATSNQMLARAKKFIERRYPEEVVTLMLLHGHAALSSQHEELLEPEPTEDEGPQTGAEARVRAAAWFTKRKRGLLAPFGVGTVDQALLAALQTRHVFVRLFGLAHKVVVIDEVHAYDAYMTTLLERVLAWLGALGSPVVMLSATLPPERRDALMRAYADGAGVQVALDQAATYPRVTWLSLPSATEPAGAITGSVHVDASVRVRRRLAVKWVDGSLPEPGSERFGLGDEFKKALRDGGCAAVICNTVRRAQEVYGALQHCFEPLTPEERPKLDLLHARFLYDEREKREERAVRRFGKPGESERPHRAVLVATQVIEQSLDLDFDLMVTDFAPIDLLLQRSGRLHRHRRGDGESERPERLRRPELWVCRPSEGDGRPVFEGGDRAVYDPHVLLRTWLELRRLESRGSLAVAIPGDVDGLVSRVYDEDSSCPEDATEELRALWNETEAHLSRRRGELSGLATSNSILPPGTPVEHLLNHWNMQLEEEDPEINPLLQALTRVEERPSVSVVLLPGTEASALDRFHKPDSETTRSLMGRSVRLSGAGLARALLEEPVPLGWQRSPLLRHHRLIELDANDAAVVGGYRLHLDPHLGVTVDRIGT